MTNFKTNLKTFTYTLLTCAVFSAQLGYSRVGGTEFGMSDAGASYPQTGYCARYNPAGIAIVANRWDAELMCGINKGRTTLKDSQIPQLNQSASAYSQDWQPFFIAGICQYVTPCICLGLSLDATRSFKTSMTKEFAIFGQGKQGVETEIPILVPTIAWKINRCHQVGFSVPVFFGRTIVTNQQNLEAVSETPGAVTNRGHDYAYGVSVRLGWIWEINPTVTFGLAYFPRLLASSHWHKYRGRIPLKGLMEVPHNLYTGFTFHFCNWTLLTELNYVWNHEERTLGNSPTSPGLLGSHDSPAFGWPNHSILHFGLERWISENFLIQGGYTVQVNPLAHRSNANVHALYNFFVTKESFDVALSWCMWGYEWTARYIRILPRRVTGLSDPTLFGGHFVVKSHLDGYTIRVGRSY
jgi:long-chain fatty acid transport protein